MSETLPPLFVDVSAGPETDGEELATLVVQLRAELLQLGVDSVELPTNSSTPMGAKGVAVDGVGTLVITIYDSAILVELIDLLKSWISRGRDRSVTLRFGSETLKVTEASAKGHARIFQSWLDAHAEERNSSSDKETGPLRIGVIVLPDRKVNEAALRAIVLAMNKEQTLVQFEFYSIKLDHPLMVMLAKSRYAVDRDQADKLLPEFTRKLHQYLTGERFNYELSEDVPDRYVIISQCCFDDNYYTTRNDVCSVLALGNWRRFMAPPSLFEFVQVLLVREVVGILCPSLDGSVHLGTKSCLMDFTPNLGDARQKIVSGYVCHFCATRMQGDGHPQLLGVVSHLINREWLGLPTDPRSPAGVAANLGADLFIVKGLSATPRERFIATLREEAAKQIVVAIGLIAVAVILVLLGIKAAG